MSGAVRENIDPRKPPAAPMDRIWSDDRDERGVSEPALVVDTEGYEGPLDLLLHLARTQKVDLARISVLALAEQYLAFVERARQLRLELAADYLVMAAWLAYLKSRLLIPQQNTDDGPSGEEMATQLAFRLKRLEAMRDAATRLINRNRLGRDVFPRGAPEPVVVERKSEFSATLYDLLNSYAQLRQRGSVRQVTIMRRRVWSLSEARVILKSIIGELHEWTALERFLVRYLSDPEERATAIASSFAASLEMVREGKLLIRQDQAFAPIYLKSAADPAASSTTQENASHD
ncbi:segregation and condensation protein A [Flavimaribacter sediminis]|nr:ScpA family protein [Flavimaribacter sediminis]